MIDWTTVALSAVTSLVVCALMAWPSARLAQRLIAWRERRRGR